ncbi:hypothetical protein QRO08_15925 [Paracidovorax citrulli]|uniref:Uncharacterized protein n=2 Tax=Paracidovorax citrulli TaxID=80869 RepID=A1TN02_PARC0|nr:hypothetical protein [Paracidovorax citrulli]ABM32340.1 hypothetical protein Aave_1753 [Paracidovorax citrulli AAC00-1]ATG94642.1 hypothetical protein CQB05_11910 [Paracidovorax citrulli]MVT28525.1 hypothetical protein [Paracidovorax citrulli]MVT38625.1 hypothetical protein [Paracidovorax citrulli]PVY66550.1 hypothetical protein C8E08_3959 [Paracidovorax citrulli]
MADLWPLLISLSHVSLVVGLMRQSSRIDRLLALKPRPFDHIVCKPGDVVCIELPPGLSKSVQRQFRDAAAEFAKEMKVEFFVVADGVRISGAKQ